MGFVVDSKSLNVFFSVLLGYIQRKCSRFVDPITTNHTGISSCNICCVLWFGKLLRCNKTTLVAETSNYMQQKLHKVIRCLFTELILPKQYL